MIKISIAILTCCLLACSLKENNQVSVPISTESIPNARVLPQDTTETTCARGVPKPSLDSTIFPQRKFALVDQLSATESVTLPNGDKIIVRHKGCESFIQTFRFETSRFQADTTEILFWYKRLVKLLSETEPAIKSPINIREGVNAIIDYIDRYSEKRLCEEIIVYKNEIPHFVTFDKIEKIDQARYALEVTFVIGPL